MRLAVAALYVLASLVMMGHSDAAQVFSCDGAEVRIEVTARESSVWEERAEAVVTVRRAQAVTVLRYLNIDFIGGECVINAESQPLVVFQAYCGGSGCKDLDNWGVVSPKTLRVLTVPSDTNRKEALTLIGGSFAPKLELLNVLAEARKQGIEVPD
jgi:hypothetical protein